MGNIGAYYSVGLIPTAADKTVTVGESTFTEFEHSTYSQDDYYLIL